MSLIEKLAIEESVPLDRVLLSKRDGTPIEPNDTPHTTGLVAADIISRSLNCLVSVVFMYCRLLHVTLEYTVDSNRY